MRQTDCQMLMSAYLIITFQNVRGEFFHMGLRGWHTTKILMQYFDLLSVCAAAPPLYQGCKSIPRGDYYDPLQIFSF